MAKRYNADSRPVLSYEPALAEVLDDPVVRAVMNRDGVGRRDILDLAAAARVRCSSVGRRPGAENLDPDGWR